MVLFCYKIISFNFVLTARLENVLISICIRSPSDWDFQTFILNLNSQIQTIHRISNKRTRPKWNMARNWSTFERWEIVWERISKAGIAHRHRLAETITGHRWRRHRTHAFKIENVLILYKHSHTHLIPIVRGNGKQTENVKCQLQILARESVCFSISFGFQSLAPACTLCIRSAHSPKVFQL